MPVGHGYFEAQAGWATGAGAYGRLEAGWRPLQPLGLFGFGQVDARGRMAGVGARVTF